MKGPTRNEKSQWSGDAHPIGSPDRAPVYYPDVAGAGGACFRVDLNTLKETAVPAISMVFGYAQKGGCKIPDGPPIMYEIVVVSIEQAMDMVLGFFHSVVKTETKTTDEYGLAIERLKSERWSDFPSWLEHLRKLVNAAVLSTSVADPISSRNQVSDQRVEVVS